MVGDVKTMRIVVLGDDGDCIPYLRGEEYCEYILRRRIFLHMRDCARACGGGSVEFVTAIEA